MMHERGSKPLLLIFPFELMAHYLRCLKLARYLNNFFEVRILKSDRYTSFIYNEGYDTFLSNRLNADKVMACIRNFDFSWLNEEDLEQVYLSQVEVINLLRPVAVLGDNSPTLKMAAETTGATYISLMNGYTSRHYAQAHPMPYSHPLYKFVKLLPDSIAPYLVDMGEQFAYKKIHLPFNRIRTKYGLPGKSSYLDETEGDINLLCDLPELFPQKMLPSNYYFVPPLYYDHYRDSQNVVAQLKQNRKTIFVSMGSSGSWNNVTFLNDPFFEMYNVVTAGDENNVINHSGVIKATFVNVNDLFPYTDLVICHGGNGTIYQALLFGLPQLCRTTHFEQQWNVEMLETLELGKSLDNVKTAEEYQALVQEWIERKHSPELLFVREKILEADRGFYRVIDIVAKTILSSAVCEAAI